MHSTTKKPSKKGQQLLSRYFTKGPASCAKATQDSLAQEADEPCVYIVDEVDSTEDIIPPTPQQKPSKQLSKRKETKVQQQHSCRSEATTPLHLVNVKTKTIVSSPIKSDGATDVVEEPHFTSISAKRKRNLFDAPTSPKKRSSVFNETCHFSVKLQKHTYCCEGLSSHISCPKEKENKPSGRQTERDIQIGSIGADSFSGTQEGRKDKHQNLTCSAIIREEGKLLVPAKQKYDSQSREESTEFNTEIMKSMTLEDADKNGFCHEGNDADDLLNNSLEFDLGDLNWDDESFESGLCSKDLKGSRPIRRSIRAAVISCESEATGCLSLKVRTLNQPEEVVVCNLSGSWRNLQVAVGDVVQVHAEFQGQTCAVDDASGFIVTYPDTLISTTTVVGSMFCSRKSILALKYKDIEGTNKEMLIGSIAHELFQWASQENVKEDSMVAMLDCLLKRNDILHQVYGLRLEDQDVRDSAMKLIPNVARWLSDYLAPTQTSSLRSCKDVSITAVRDIEENYWCPRLGLKGKIDVTTEVKIHGQSPSAQKLLPLELKTGKHSFSFEHMGQVILYSLMMSERYDEDTAEGLLLYIRDGIDMKRVPSKHRDRCGLLQRRNDLACHLAKQRNLQVDVKSKTVHAPEDILPQPINSERYCTRCPLSTVCSIYQSTASDAVKELPSFVKESIQHLSATHLSYFTTWCSLLDLEHLRSTANNQDSFWVEDALKREEKGQCFSNLRLINTQNISPVRDDGGQVTYHHCFRRGVSESGLKTLLSVGLSVGDRVAVSDQQQTNTVAFGVGTITVLTESDVTVKLDRNMFAYPNWQKAVFRIDRLYSSAVFSICFSNLAILMSKDEKSGRLRDFVIDGVPPNFKKTLPKQWVVACRKALKPLNDIQRRAIVKFLLADDYLLIKGMPGTGKTTTIAALVQVLLLLGQSVLLTSYTHSALDSILLKLVQSAVPFVRLGAVNRIHDRVKEFSADFQTKMLKTAKELKEFYNNQSVIATTCLGLNHPAIYCGRSFDVCIIDEASQAIQPSCLGPLLHAKRFVLVGDPQQLPPVIQSQDARKLGMDVSLFERMQTNQNTVTLSMQYRMNSEIMHLCNSLTYEGKLQCASDKVSGATLSLPQVGNFVDLLPDDSWVMQAVSQEPLQSAVFICTDAVDDAEDLDTTGSACNRKEAVIVSQLLHVFTKCGMEPAEIGIITPFRKQVQLLKEMLCSYKGVDISTVDQYQGREKAAILFSCVKSHGKEVSDTEILNDCRRLNVAVSRAKHKLILIGSRGTVQKYQPFQKLLSSLRPDQFICLKPGDENIYRSIIYGV